MDNVAPLNEISAEIKAAGGAAYKYCYQCGKCDVVCPWGRVKTFSIRKIIRQAAFGLSEIELEDLWRCSTCGSCPSHCPRGVEQIEVGVALRRLATAYGVFPASVRGARAAGPNVVTSGNPFGEDREKRAQWAQDLGVREFTEGTEFLYFVGCYYCYDPRMKKAARATAEVLTRAGVDFGILGTRESCCGESVRKTGNEEAWKAVARENIKTFIDRGVRRILVSSPHCLHTLRNEYPELMVRFEVVHITELLQELLASGRLKLTREVRRRVAYHDPCYLGRHNGIYDAPRAILGRVPGLELLELPMNRADSLCCGGGGGGIWMDTAKNERVADLRLQQAQAVGAEALVTACPYCVTNFESSRLTLEDQGTADVPAIVEIAELVQAAL